MNTVMDMQESARAVSERLLQNVHLVGYKARAEVTHRRLQRAVYVIITPLKTKNFKEKQMKGVLLSLMVFTALISSA
jgi:hypothetical protein